MTDPYIEERDGGYFVAGTRISLDSVVYMFRDGYQPAEIQESYRGLALPQIYRAIAFYLENRELVDRNLEETDELVKANSIPLAEANPAMWARLEQARQELRAKQGMRSTGECSNRIECLIISRAARSRGQPIIHQSSNE
jgi:uncharacterized protein (DUF433 family)